MLNETVMQQFQYQQQFRHLSSTAESLGDPKILLGQRNQDGAIRISSDSKVLKNGAMLNETVKKHSFNISAYIA